ncbi:TPA: class I SAM-dependent DNA methyltransferase, partial [Legionella pneumophila]
FKTDEDLHALNVYLSRLLFCFFAEDTGIFDQGIFTNSISSYTQLDGSDLNSFFGTLFEVLNIEVKERYNYPEYLNKFPYVNGGLFRKKHTNLKFSLKIRKMIIDSGTLDWSEINPDIFGSMIQAVVHPDQRGGLGMHYTSVPNIMKVIEPLFLNELREEFQINYNQSKNLEKLLVKLENICFFDPACGSGNFLIIAYKEIRKLEIEIIQRIKETCSQMSFYIESRIFVSSFFGIELDDFACEIATLSLWLAEHQMNLLFKDTFGHCSPSLPLKAGGNIKHGNAIQLEWESVCPKDRMKKIYIFGNPPYLGSSMQNKVQKEELKSVCLGFKNYKNLDYIACWFIKATKYICHEDNALFAFVSTNSICQGEQVALLWPFIFKNNLEIFFAHHSFKWSNNAKGKAGVSVIIVGLRNINKKNKTLYTDNTAIKVNNINPYLTAGKNIVLPRRTKPISNIPAMVYGNKATENGYLLLSPDEKDKILAENHEANFFIKKLVGSNELINGIERYCLWIDDSSIDLANKTPEIRRRLELVRLWRLESLAPCTVKYANYPNRFKQITYKKMNAIVVPRVSSERRKYIPFGFVDQDTVVIDSAQVIHTNEPFVFGIISSIMHMVWVKATSGCLESRIRYSSALSYNNFPIPELSENQKETIASNVFNILDEREKHPEKTLAELYDPQKMPQGLKEAHRNLDLVVDLFYRSKPFVTDEERLEVLFGLYEDMISREKSGANL